MTQVTTVPSLAARNGQLPDPLAPGQTIPVNPSVSPFSMSFRCRTAQDFGDGLAEYRFEAVRPMDDSFGQGRIDFDLGRGNRLFARVTLDSASKTEPANYPGAGVDWESIEPLSDRRGPSRRVGLRSSIQRRFSHSLTDLEQTDTTGQGLDGALSIVPGRGMPHLRIGGMPAFGSLVSPHTRARQRLFAFADDVAISKGSHLLKMGALVEQLRGADRFPDLLAGTLQLSGHRPVPAGTSHRAVPGACRIRVSPRALDHAVRPLRSGRHQDFAGPDAERRAALGVRDRAD